jgi:hypothetical protein
MLGEREVWWRIRDSRLVEETKQCQLQGDDSNRWREMEWIDIQREGERQINLQ